jgi:Metal-dependent hydrolase
MPVRRRDFRHSLPVLLIIMLTFAPLISFALSSPTPSDTKFLETGRAAKAETKAAASTPDEIKVVTYNMRWRGGEDLRKLIKLLKEDAEIGKAAVIGLQEVDRDKKRTGNANTARLMAEELGMHYAWAAPAQAKGKELAEEETGVALLSHYPMADVKRIVLPHEGPGGRRRVALGATIHIGPTSLRVYSVHAETRTSNEKRLEQFKAVLEDLQAHAKIKHSIVLGDFNTITGKDVDHTSRLFINNGFHTPFSNDEATWKTFIIELKLDWLWLRGLDVKAYGIDKKITLSDHWPLWIVVKTKDEKQAVR